MRDIKPTNEELLFALAAELELIVFSDDAQTTPKIKKTFEPTTAGTGPDKPFSLLT